MAIVMFFFVCLVVADIRLWTMKKKQEEALAATQEWCEMSVKLRELIERNAPRGEWKKWLVRCREANQFFFKTHPFINSSRGLPEDIDAIFKIS